jgi:outer membrane protein
MRRKTLPFLVLAVACAFAPAAFAQSAGDWSLAVGAHRVDPDADNGALAGGTLPLDIGADTRPTIAVEYFLKDNLGLEVLAALPFEHDIAIAGLGRVGSTKHLPPTVSLQYHFNAAGRVSPFLGAGVNYTAFFEEKTAGALDGARLSLDDSWGLAAHAGLDFRVGAQDAIRVDVRWIDIDTDVTVDGESLGSARIDPLVYGAAYVRRF